MRPLLCQFRKLDLAIEADACGDERLQIAKGGGIDPAIAGLAAKRDLDLRQGQSVVALQLADREDRLDMAVVIVGDIGGRPSGVGEQATTNIDPYVLPMRSKEGREWKEG